MSSSSSQFSKQDYAADAHANSDRNGSRSKTMLPLQGLLKIALAVLIGVVVHAFISDPHPEDAYLLNKNPSNCDVFLKSSFSDRQQSAINNFSVAENSFECFFAKDYFSARSLFVDSLKRVKGSKHLTFPIYKDLTTDVGVIPGSKNSKKTILHISGTHGTEGYAGSAVQSAILAYLASSQITDGEGSNEAGFEVERPNIVLVHALNPYGFANNRRVNEDNIDLNRNFLSESQFAFVKARDPDFAGYVRADYVINPKGFISSIPLINDLHGYFMMGYAASVLGMQTLKKALVSGNYFKKEGLGFGGFELSKSSQNLIELVKSLEEIKNADDLVLIDVHTGLGPKGVDTLGTSSSVENIDNYFKTEYFYESKRPLGGLVTLMKAASSDSALSGYELTVGEVTEDFCRHFLLPQLGEANKLCITQEFGTISMMAVGKSLVDENLAFHNSVNDALKAKYTKKLRDSFYVDDSLFWKRNVVRRGVMVFNQGNQYLSR